LKSNFGREDRMRKIVWDSHPYLVCYYYHPNPSIELLTGKLRCEEKEAVERWFAKKDRSGSITLFSPALFWLPQ
jgi:hypothetical protein